MQYVTSGLDTYGLIFLQVHRPQMGKPVACTSQHPVKTQAAKVWDMYLTEHHLQLVDTQAMRGSFISIARFLQVSIVILLVRT